MAEDDPYKVVGSNTKSRYKKTVGDNGRTYTDEKGNSYNDAQFKAKEGDYTEDAGRQFTTRTEGGTLSGRRVTESDDKYTKPTPAPSSLGDLAKKIGMEQTPTPDPGEEAEKKRKKMLQGMP